MESNRIVLPSKESTVKVLLDKSRRILEKIEAEDGIQKSSGSLWQERPTKPKA